MAPARRHTKRCRPGNGQAFDPVNPAENWSGSSTFTNIFTESATTLQYRDDLQLISGPMMNQYGMQQVPGSYTAFGNNGTTAFMHSVSAAGNTALADLPNQSAVLSALTTATDHLPVVADYGSSPCSGMLIPTGSSTARI